MVSELFQTSFSDSSSWLPELVKEVQVVAQVHWLGEVVGEKNLSEHFTLLLLNFSFYVWGGMRLDHQGV
jgi:hypothetical protein